MAAQRAEPHLQSFWVMVHGNNQDHNFRLDAQVSKHVTLRHRHVHADLLKNLQNCYGLPACHLEDILGPGEDPCLLRGCSALAAAEEALTCVSALGLTLLDTILSRAVQCV